MIWPSSSCAFDLHLQSIVMIYIVTGSTPWSPLLCRGCLDKVKQLHGICISYNKETTIRLLPLADNFLQNMIISYNNVYHIMSWPYHITTCPAKTSYTSSTLLLQVLRGCYGLLARTVLTYGKTTTIVRQVSVDLSFARTRRSHTWFN